MNWAEMVVAIVAMGTAGKVLRARYQAHRPDERPAADPEVARAQAEVRQLRERVQVLERVITDTHGSSDLDREIERLRDR